ncbi:MAG: dTDP-4-amino-4,6-dideoxygalactose transaminase [Flavobacteriales bacterium]|nr:dTDP-4-amino-4,6-dideoxygalactose transaminase [Flavobacteriales bacterium]MCB9364770.1 dTDP-4-amino-4,6-dideoxygalactose transaminase [Flavobacteriales bacterium]
MKIPFNIPYISGNEVNYINDVIKTQSYSSAGKYNLLCEKELSELTTCENVRLTGSATAALEIAALAIDIQPGDEVILPSFTYVTTANAFVLRGAKLVFVDINPNTMCLDEGLLKKAITSKTKAVVMVHYAGFTSNINKIVQLCKKENIFLIEDAAQSIDSYYENQHLGTFGDFGCISFHDTKNIHCGEGGALLINSKTLLNKVDVIIEKGTNRKDFLLGNEGTYSWKGLGSSYGLSEISAAFLLAQLKDVKQVTAKRKELYDLYQEKLRPLKEGGKIDFLLHENNHNAHIFFIKVKDKAERNKLIDFLGSKNIAAYFHYLPLHLSDMGNKYLFIKNDTDFSLYESERLVRLPLYCQLQAEDVKIVTELINSFYLN